MTKLLQKIRNGGFVRLNLVEYCTPLSFAPGRDKGYLSIYCAFILGRQLIEAWRQKAFIWNVLQIPLLAKTHLRTALSRYFTYSSAMAVDDSDKISSTKKHRRLLPAPRLSIPLCCSECHRTSVLEMLAVDYPNGASIPGLTQNGSMAQKIDNLIQIALKPKLEQHELGRLQDSLCF